MRTLTTPAIAKPSTKSPTATLWDTPVPVSAPTPSPKMSPPVASAPVDDKPPFNVPDEPAVESVAQSEELPGKEIESVTGSVSFASGPGKPFTEIGEIVGQVFSIPGSSDPMDVILFIKEHKLLDPIYAAHASILEAEQRELELENELADLRFNLSDYRDAKKQLLEELPMQLFTIRTGQAPLNVVPKSPKPESAPAAPTEPDNAWRAILTNTITKGVVGLGVKKAETLIDEFPTLGDLCDAMARATAAHRHFADELPKGIGKQSADELANRVMAAQTKGDTRPAAEVVEPRKKKTSVVIESPGVGGASHATFVREWLKEVSDVATEKDLRVYEGESFDEGFEAASEGAAAFDCPEGFKREHQIDWLCGWLCYTKFNSDADPVTESGDTTDTTNIDDNPDLHSRFVESAVKWLSDNPDELSVDKASDREIWQVGFDAAHEGAVAEDCPVEVATTSQETAVTEAMQVDWLRGWCAAMIEVAKEHAEPTIDDTTTNTDEPPRILSAATESKLLDAIASPVAEPATIDEPDDIAEIVKQVRLDRDKRSRTSREAWERGYQAAVDQMPIETFPHLPLAELTDWVRGWVSGESVDFAGL
jgi:ribosome modulation factor